MEENSEEVPRHAEIPDSAISGGEKRQYVLNRETSLRKKKNSCDREVVCVEETGGGTMFKFNTGTYEILKAAVDEFYQKDATLRYSKTPVTDKQHRNVETKYKVFKGKSSYTLNMYHTTSSCLVNGKIAQTFLDDHLTSILDLIKEKLSINNLDINKMNNQIKTVLSNRSLHVDPDDGVRQELPSVLSVTPSFVPSVTPSTLPSVTPASLPSITPASASVPSVTPSVPSITPSDLPSVTPASTSVPSVTSSALPSVTPSVLPSVTPASVLSVTPSTLPSVTLSVLPSVTPASVSSVTPCAVPQKDPVTDVLVSIQETIENVKTTLQKHIIDTNKNFQDIREDLDCVKKGLDKSSKRSEKQIDLINSSTNSLKSICDKTKTAILKDIETLSIVIKNIKRDSASSPPTSPKSTTIASQRLVERSPPKENISVEDDAHGQRDTENHSARTLIVGDSLLKGIQKRGLRRNVEVTTLPGRKSRDIKTHLQKNVTSNGMYKNVVVYVGGNDASDNIPMKEVYENLVGSVKRLREKDCNVFVCTNCPRKDVDVRPLNETISRVCSDSGASLIDVYSSCTFGDGQAARQLFNRDGIHLNNQGSSHLVQRIHREVPIVKTRESTPLYSGASQSFLSKRVGFNTPWQTKRTRPGSFKYGRTHGVRTFCKICKMNNHHTNECRYNTRV